jgi:hypothetical protein
VLRFRKRKSSAVGRLNDPWGDLVNYFRDLSVTQVKLGLVAEKVNGRMAFAVSAIRGPQDVDVLA